MGALTTKIPAKAAPAAPAKQAAPPPPRQAPAPVRKGGFADAKPRSNGGIFLKEMPDGSTARYTVRINQVKQGWANPKAVDEDYPQPTPEELLTAKPTFSKQDVYIIELEVIESNNELCPPGYLASVVFTNRYPESYMGDIKGFICAVANAAPEQVDIDDWEKSYKPDQPFAGALVDVTVSLNAKKTFTRHVFNVNKTQHPDAE